MNPRTVIGLSRFFASRMNRSEIRVSKTLTQLRRNTPLFSSLEELHDKLTELLGKGFNIIRQSSFMITSAISESQSSLLEIISFGELCINVCILIIISATKNIYLSLVYALTDTRCKYLVQHISAKLSLS